MRLLRPLKLGLQLLFIFALFQFIGPSTIYFTRLVDQVRVYTRTVEFDYIEWTLDAIVVKLDQAMLNPADHLDDNARHDLVIEYTRLIYDIKIAEAHLNDIYTDPAIANPETSARLVRGQLDDLYAQRQHLGPLAESILQDMLSATLAEMGFTGLSQPVPPVLYHSTPLPWALIVSPRDTIQQDANISLQVDLTLEEHIAIEDQIAAGLNVSTLIVPVGGVGVYPTMVAESSNLVWLVETIAHEWMHNYLTIRPLGALYNKDNDLRTMNETTASIAGTEIGRALLARYFPELLPPETPPPAEAPQTEEPPEPVFDFRAEMHETRVTVDEMLANGEIEEAEAYMESRRQIFWENGYHIRKLNQAYFAFYGAYADEPGGIAGEDPVGTAVRQLRANSDSLLDFINQIAWLTSFDSLLAEIE